MEGQPVVVKRSIGPLGYLLEISPPDGMPRDVLNAKIREIIDSQMSEAAKREAIAALGVQYPDVTFVLDISGSMGDHVRRARMAVNAAMLQCGYQDTSRLNFITFTNNAVLVQVRGNKPSVNDLVTSLQNVVSSGGTCVAGVFPLLPAILRPADPVAAATPQILIVISDGEIQDKADALAAAQRVSQSLGPAQVSIHGVLLRLLTSQGARPDTQALACFGSFCTENAALIDVNAYQSQEELGLLTLTETIVNGIQNAGVGASVNVRSADGTAIFRRLPGVPGLSELRVRAGTRTYVLVDPGVALDNVMIDGKQVAVVDGGVINNEASLSSLLSFIDQQLRMWTLTGQTANIPVIKSWLENLQAYLTTVESAALNDADLSLAGRARSIQRSIKKRQGSILSRILEMEGSDRVKGMNAQQQADWLRKADDNRSGRALARRAGKAAGGELDYSGQCQEVVKYIGSQAGGLSVAQDNEESSFYSLSTGSDGIVALRTDLLPLVDDLTMADVLQIAGLVGVPFEAPVGDYVEPYAIRPRSVYSGQFLAEQDMWLIRSQSTNPEVKFACPGRPNSNITGVIALRSCNPKLYDFMLSRPMRPLFEMQVSAQMRHMVSVVPQDAVALNVCSIGTLVNVLASKGVLTSVERETLNSMIDNIMHLIGPKGYNPESFLEMYASLRHDDPRAWLSGDRNVSNVMKIFAVLIRYYFADGQPDATVNLPRVLRALYYLDAYQAVKRVVKGDDPNARPNLIKLTLGIDFAKHATPLTPLFDPEPENPAHHDVVVLESLTIPESVPRTRYYSAWKSVLTRVEAVPEDDVETFGGISGRSIRAVAAVQALLCPNESDRINTADRTCALPDPTTDADALVYIRGVVRSQYAADYETRLASKRQQETQIKLDRQVKELIDAKYQDFKVVLVGPQSMIPNRDCKGFPMIFSAIMDMNAKVTDRLEKLVLLTTGRETGDPAVSVWCNGNFLPNRWDEIAVLTESCGAKDLMVNLRAMRKAYGIHKYRGGAATANRHHHSDDFPSYWALGYKDLHHFKASDPVECQRYIQAHCIAKGCCLPNENERGGFGINK